MLLILNYFLQYKYIPIERLLGLFIKLILIAYLGFQWSHLGEIIYAIQNGMNSIASKLMALGSSSTKLTVAGAIDDLIKILIEKKKVVDANYDWSTNSTMTIITT
ncbi:hypothetical protein [Paenochrobactrum pullorum]|uniref:hypothetical protein n=1 Tax=Paenochrobactrum pullorum TaxID=1324351 RepID=UPI0035BBD7D2